ncbi:MAG: hypothetical protein JWO81_878 [Alphaproteobacteria bacterium]|nr:hypothetical protein [Alphaproteobacteria bacterium]
MESSYVFKTTTGASRNSFSIWKPQVAGNDLLYSRAAEWFIFSSTREYCVFGVPIQSVDVLSTGSLSFSRSTVLGEAYMGDGSVVTSKYPNASLLTSSSRVGIDAATGVVAMTLTINVSRSDGTTETLANFTGSGTYDRTSGRVGGTFAAPEYSAAGTFEGQIFGPRSELGYAFSFTSPAGTAPAISGAGTAFLVP